MMLTTFILLITANHACEAVTRTVTVSIADGEGTSLNCRGTETFDEKTGLGSLVIKSTDQSSWTGFFNGLCKKVKTILDTLQNSVIAKNYCLKKTPISKVRISMVTEDTRILSCTAAYEPDKVTLQILPGVQINGKNAKGKHGWSVKIPYRKDWDIVNITEVAQNLTVLGDWNRTVPCLKIHVENMELYPSLKVEKRNFKNDFMTLQYSTLPIFLENNRSEDAEQQNIILPVTFGEIVDLFGAYYVEYSLDKGANVQVRVTTPDLLHRVRYICGFTNKKKDQVTFFPTTIIQTVTVKESTNFVTVKDSVSWAFDGATKLEVSYKPRFGIEDWNFVEIVLAGLRDTMLTNDNDSPKRILKVLPLYPVEVPTDPAPY